MMRRNHKGKILSIALATMLAATMPGISVSAEEMVMPDVELETEIEEDAIEIQEEIPVEIQEEIGEEIGEEIVEEADQDFEEETEATQDEATASVRTIEEAGKILRAGMVAREASIKITIAKDAGFGPEATDAILDETYKHTGVENEGDYLKHNVSFITSYFETDEEQGTTTLCFDICYNTTLDQENVVAAEIQKLDSKYKIADMTSDYDKVMALYELIGDTVDYDYARKDNAVVITDPKDFHQENYIQHTAYAALVNHYAVCEGYALLFYRLALHYHMDNRIVTGFSNGEDHGWNVVQVSGKYYYVDTTWDSGRARNDYQYFLKSANDMYDHALDEESEAVTAGLRVSEESQEIKTPAIKTSGIYKYVLSYGAIIVGIDNTSKSAITIPSTLGGKPVVSLDCSIGDENSYDYNNTTGITFPDGIYRIKGYSWLFDAAASVTFPSTLFVDSEIMNRLNLDNLQTIKVNAGSKTLKVEKNVLYTYDGSALVKYPGKSTATSYHVLDGTKEIYPLAFRYASKLTEVTLPNSVEEIGSFSFEECSALKKINISAQLKRLGEWAFSGTKLSGKITFPAGMEWINGADYIGTSVTAFEIPEGNEAGYFTDNGIICYDFNREGIKQVIEAPPVMENPVYSVPDDFVYVVSNAFKDTNLREISLNEGLISLGNCALENCPNLSKVIVPSSVKSIDERTFGYNDKNLKEVYILSKNLDIWGDPFSGTTTAVYGYKDSTIEKHCKEMGITFKEITDPVYNWGVNGERCSMTMLDASKNPVSYQADQIETISEDGATLYTATFKVNGKTYTNSKQNEEIIMEVVPETTEFSSVKDSSSGVVLSWTKNTTADGYYIYRDSKLVMTIDNPETETYTDTSSLTNGSLYTYKIVAFRKAASGEILRASAGSEKFCYLTKPSLSIANASTGCKVSWKENDQATGYYVYRSIAGAAYKKVKTITSPSTFSFTDTGANVNGKKYSYKVFAYKTVSDTTYKSLASSAKTYYFVTRPAISSLTCSAKKTMLVKWAKKTGVTGYQIQYSTSSKFSSGNKSVTVSGASSVSKAIASLTKGKTYYVRLRCYKTVSSTKYYSAWSGKKSVKISK